MAAVGWPGFVALVGSLSASASNTVSLIKNVNTTVDPSRSSAPSSFLTIGGTTYFVADGASNSRGLWKSDGTPAGTSLVKDIQTGPGNGWPAQLANVDGVLFFVANNDGGSAEPWRSNGTEAGTTLVKRLSSGWPGSTILGLTAAWPGGGRFFAAVDFSFKVNDGQQDSNPATVRLRMAGALEYPPTVER